MSSYNNVVHANYADNDKGLFMKQESVSGSYNPIPMTPTLNSHKTFLSAAKETPAAKLETLSMKRNASYGSLGNQAEARVLVLYTGGTIGMLRNEKNGKQIL
jgi:hypothetical protein